MAGSHPAGRGYIDMLTRALVLALLVSGCAIDDETDVVEEASLNCPTADPDCDPYPTPPPRKPDLGHVRDWH